MAEPQKKGMGKGVVIALGVLVVILGISNVYVYTTLQSQINALNTDKINLQNQVNSLSQYIADFIQPTLSEWAMLRDRIVVLEDIVSLKLSQVLIDNQTISQPASDYTHWNFTLSYAGYVSVNVESSTTTNTFVEVVYTSHGVNYDERITVGTSGTAVFPVLPSDSVQTRVGNTDLINGATETVTVTYYY